MIFVGCDLGSTTGKIVVLDENLSVLGSSIVRSSHGPIKTFEKAVEKTAESMGISAEELLTNLRMKAVSSLPVTAAATFPVTRMKSLKFPATPKAPVIFAPLSARLLISAVRTVKLSLLGHKGKFWTSR